MLYVAVHLRFHLPSPFFRRQYSVQQRKKELAALIFRLMRSHLVLLAKRCFTARRSEAGFSLFRFFDVAGGALTRGEGDASSWRA